MDLSKLYSPTTTDDKNSEIVATSPIIVSSLAEQAELFPAVARLYPHPAMGYHLKISEASVLVGSSCPVVLWGRPVRRSFGEDVSPKGGAPSSKSEVGSLSDDRSSAREWLQGAKDRNAYMHGRPGSPLRYYVPLSVIIC